MARNRVRIYLFIFIYVVPSHRGEGAMVFVEKKQKKGGEA